MNKSCTKLKEEKYAAIVLGDFRIRGIYYPFHSDFISLMENLKDSDMILHDVVVLQSVTFDRANIRFGSCKNSKITSKVHEYLLVFKKASKKETFN